MKLCYMLIQKWCSDILPDLVMSRLIDKCAWPFQSRSHGSAAVALQARLLRLVQGDPELHIVPKFLEAHPE